MLYQYMEWKWWHHPVLKLLDGNLAGDKEEIFNKRRLFGLMVCHEIRLPSSCLNKHNMSTVTVTKFLFHRVLYNEDNQSQRMSHRGQCCIYMYTRPENQPLLQTATLNWMQLLPPNPPLVSSHFHLPYGMQWANWSFYINCMIVAWRHVILMTIIMQELHDFTQG